MIATLKELQSNGRFKGTVIALFIALFIHWYFYLVMVAQPGF